MSATRPHAGALPATRTDPATLIVATPQSTWALARNAWRLYMAHKGTLLLPVLLIELPLLFVITAVLTLLDAGPTVLTADWVVRFTVYVLAQSVMTLTEAVMAFLLLAVLAVQIAALLRGGRLSLGAALRTVPPRLGALLGGSFLLIMSVGLLTVLGVVLTVVFSLVVTVLNAQTGGTGLEGALQAGLANPTQNLWWQLLLLSAVSALAIFLVVKWSLMVQVVVLEDAPPVQSLRRSGQLVRGAFWRTLGLLLIGMLPTSLLSNGPMLAEFFNLVPEGPNRLALLALARAAGLFLRILLLPWALTLLTLYYYDLQARHAVPGREAGV